MTHYLSLFFKNKDHAYIVCFDDQWIKKTGF